MIQATPSLQAVVDDILRRLEKDRVNYRAVVLSGESPTARTSRRGEGEAGAPSLGVLYIANVVRAPP